MTGANDDALLQRVEALERWTEQRLDDATETHQREHRAHDLTHQSEHVFEGEATRLREEQLTTASASHEKQHDADDLAIKTALASVDRLADVHAEAHKREHLNHDQRHADGAVAVGKAELAVDKRLEQMNEVRGQLRDQQQTFATNERVQTLQASFDQRLDLGTRHTDERYEENRRRIETLEKGDIGQTNKAEGRSLGQGAIIALIVGGVTFAVTVIGLIVAIGNVVTGQ